MKKRGFSLIELILVIAIIGLLAAVITVSVSGAKIRGRDARRDRDIHEIRTALGLYAADNGRFPTADEPYPVVLSGADDISTALISGGHIPKIPTDPIGNDPLLYSYTAITNGGSYVLRYCYEATSECREISP